ncbi:MAG: phospholipase D family protein [Acidobacteria bacterium]|nr:phospholipase D family protein [Acidobacteriota bacterium]
MLEPHARTLLFDILRPPEDHRLDIAVATTYTLDLLALLTAPVAFSLFEVDDQAELLNHDSLTLLESLRRYADRLTVFCQAGQIAFPKAQFPQLEYLEHSVIECRRPGPGASFHSKVWLLRFLGPDEGVRYRLACLSRNLTFDRCWDTGLTLEGPLLDRQKAIAANHPLGDFVQALPARALRTVSQEIAGRVDRIQAEVRRVQFELPEGFDEYRFHPLGAGRRAALPFDGTDGRILIISPFVSQDGLRRVTKGRKGSILVTRPETLKEGACRTPETERFFVLASEASPTSTDVEEVPASKGLHAKCYIVDDGWNARVWTGSANATESGFSRNVEFLVELVGPKSKFGIDALLQSEDGKTSLADLLQEMSAPDAPDQRDEIGDGLRAAIDRVRDSLSSAGLEATIVEAEGGYDLRIISTSPLKDLPAETSVSCWPVTVGKGRSRPVDAGAVDVTFPALSVEGLSGFIAFEVRASREGRNSIETFVFNLPLEGAPADRRERLLRSVLKDRRRLFQYLLLLLSDEGIELAERMRIEQHGNSLRAMGGRADTVIGSTRSIHANAGTGPRASRSRRNVGGRYP